MTKKRAGAKMGRPPIDPAIKRGVILCIRITRQERARLFAEACRLRTSAGEVLMRPWRKKGGAK